MKLINIRGTNGSGKSSAARYFLQPEDKLFQVDLAHWKTKGGSLRHVEGTVNETKGVIVVGSYSTMAGGMDKIKTFELAQDSIRRAIEIGTPNGITGVIFEGIVASTVFGSWATFAKEQEAQGHKFCWCYILTPGRVCLERIQARNGGKAIKEDLVWDKIKAIKATRTKAIASRFRVFDLPTDEVPGGGLTLAGRAVEHIVKGMGGEYAAT